MDIEQALETQDFSGVGHEYASDMNCESDGLVLLHVAEIEIDSLSNLQQVDSSGAFPCLVDSGAERCSWVDLSQIRHLKSTQVEIQVGNGHLMRGVATGVLCFTQVRLIP